MYFFFSSRRRHTRSYGDWSSDVCSSDLSRLGIRKTCGRPGSGDGQDRNPDLRFAGQRLNLSAEGFRRETNKLLRARSEERRVGKECRCGWSASHGGEKVRLAGIGGLIDA